MSPATLHGIVQPQNVALGGLTLGVLAESQNLTLGVLHPDPWNSATSLSYVRKLSVHSTSFSDRTGASRWRVLSTYFCMMLVRSAAFIFFDHDTLSFDRYRCD